MVAKKDPNRFFKGEVGTGVKDPSGATKYGGTAGSSNVSSNFQVSESSAKAITEKKRYDQAHSSGNVYVPLGNYEVTSNSGVTMKAESGGQVVKVSKTVSEATQQKAKQEMQNNRNVVQAVREQYLNPVISNNDLGAVKKVESGYQDTQRAKQYLREQYTRPNIKPEEFGIVLKAKNDIDLATQKKYNNVLGAGVGTVAGKPNISETTKFDLAYAGVNDFVVGGTVSVGKGFYKFGGARVDQMGFLIATDKDVQSAAIASGLAVVPIVVSVPIMAGFTGYTLGKGIVEGDFYKIGQGSASALFTFAPLVGKGLPKYAETTRPTGRVKLFLESKMIPSNRGGAYDVTYSSKMFVEVAKESRWFKTLPEVSQKPLNYVFKVRGQSVRTAEGGGSEYFLIGGGGKAKINPKTGKVKIVSESIKSEPNGFTTEDTVKPFDYVKDVKPQVARQETPIIQVSSYTRKVKPKKLLSVKNKEVVGKVIYTEDKAVNSNLIIKGKELGVAKINKNIGNLGEYYPSSGNIQYNPKLISKYPQISEKQVIFHEYGHGKTINKNIDYDFMTIQVIKNKAGKLQDKYILPSGSEIPKREAVNFIKDVKNNKAYSKENYPDVYSKFQESSADIVGAIIRGESENRAGLTRSKYPTIYKYFENQLKKDNIVAGSGNVKDLIQTNKIDILKAGSKQEVSAYVRKGRTVEVSDISFSENKISPMIETTNIKQENVLGIEFQQVKRIYNKKSNQPISNKINKLSIKDKEKKDFLTRLNTPEKEYKGNPQESVLEPVVIADKVLKGKQIKPTNVKVNYDPNKQSFNFISGSRIMVDTPHSTYSTEIFIPNKKEITANRFNPIIVEKQNIEPSFSYIPINRFNQNQEPKPNFDQINEPIQRQPPINIIEPVTIVKPIQDISPIIKITPIQDRITGFSNFERQNRINKPFKFGLPSSSKKSNENGMISLSVRRRGKFNLIGAFASPEEAYSQGRIIVRQTAAASFKIGGKVNKLFDTDIVASKREPFVFVQKRERRISSFGEKVEISQRGLFAQKIKKSMWKVF